MTILKKQESPAANKRVSGAWTHQRPGGAARRPATQSAVSSRASPRPAPKRSSLTPSLPPLTMALWMALVLLATIVQPCSGAHYDFVHCDPKCEESLCPELTYCEGVPLKDSCNCCMVCSVDRHQPHAHGGGGGGISVTPSGGEACKQVTCPKFKICSENMQGLPLCKCPNTYFCRQKKKREICATDGQTYPSRCHMRVASCHLGSAVRKKYRGPCSPERDRKLRKRRLRNERKRAKEEAAAKGGGGGGRGGSGKRKSGRKNNGKDRLKRKRTNRKRRKTAGRRTRGKRRTRRHRRNHRFGDVEASRAFEEAFAHYTWSK